MAGGDTVHVVDDGVLTVRPMPRGAPKHKGQETGVGPP